MWVIFPQLAGLGCREMSRRYAITGLEEARDYLAHPELGARLHACAEALLDVPYRSIGQILGSPDDLKLHSSATLFARVSPPGLVFHRLIDEYCSGQPDAGTLRLLDRLE